jgi:4-hydroxy-tetrahydrodipicolinate reductase
MRALLVGYGKMGRAIEAALVQRGNLVAGCSGRREIEEFLEGHRAGESLARSGDLAFEFTTPHVAPLVVPLLLSQNVPVLSGTTGWDIRPAVQLAREHSVPFLHSPNFSLGVAALRRAAAAAAAALAAFPEFQAGIVERHHAAKKDAPSGTAKTLAAEVARASEGREPAVVSLRQGGAPGEHALFFEGADETLELVHRARSRAIFALGAVRAAEWMLTSGRTGPLTFDDFFDSLTTAARRGNDS